MQRRLRELHEKWWLAEQLARKAHGEFRGAIEELLEGGPKPSREQLNRMDNYRRLADQYRAQLDDMLVELMQ